MSGSAAASSFGIFASHRTGPVACLTRPPTSRGRCSCRLALYRPRVVDIDLDILAGKGRHGHLRRALRRAKAVPCALRNDGDRASAKLEELRRPAVAHDFQGHSAVEDVNQLVAGEMAFPMIFPRGLDGQKEAVAVGSQLCDASLAIGHRRTGGPSEHSQLREFCVEIDYAGRSACHFSLQSMTAVCGEAPSLMPAGALPSEGRRHRARYARWDWASRTLPSRPPKSESGATHPAE